MHGGRRGGGRRRVLPLMVVVHPEGDVHLLAPAAALLLEAAATHYGSVDHLCAADGGGG
jgi:hypothetical protein